MFRKIVAFTLAVVMTCTPVAAARRRAPWKMKGRYYAQITRVVKIRKRVDCDVVRVINASRQTYEFFTDRGDYELNDRVAVIMDTRGTEYVMDDWVVAAKFDRPDLLG